MSVGTSLGELLQSLNVVEAPHLAAALERQRTQGGRLGHVLAELGFVDEFAIRDAVGQRLGLQVIDLDAHPPRPEAVALLPTDYCAYHGIVPVEVRIASDGVEHLCLAMSDPTNETVLAEVRYSTAKSAIEVVVATDSQIDLALQGGVPPTPVFGVMEWQAAPSEVEESGPPPAVEVQANRSSLFDLSGATGDLGGDEAAQIRAEQAREQAAREQAARAAAARAAAEASQPAGAPATDGALEALISGRGGGPSIPAEQVALALAGVLVGRGLVSEDELVAALRARAR